MANEIYFAEKEKRLALGVYPEVSLKEARDKWDEARKMLREGIDPSQVKREKKLQHKIEIENTFELVAREWLDNRRQDWTERHARYTLRRLEADIFPHLSFKVINKVTATELLTVLRDVEKKRR